MATCDKLLFSLGLFSSTQVHSSYIYWYTQKTVGATLLILEKYIFICSYVYNLFLLFSFTVNNEHIHKCFSKSLCFFYYSTYFFGDYESSFISWTSINSWFLKFSLKQTNRKCKVFHFTWLCKIWIEWFFLFSHFWHCLNFNFNEVRTEIGIWQYTFNILDIYKKILTIFLCIFS